MGEHLFELSAATTANVPYRGNCVSFRRLGSVQWSKWAAEQAERYLAPLGRRWTHSRGVAMRAAEVGVVLGPAEREVAVAAGYLHDVGYAPSLARTGFHPLDGARWLAELGHDRLAGLVAHHSGSRHEAALRGLSVELGAFPEEASLVAAVLTYCDLTTGPNGESMSPEQRLADVGSRHGVDGPVAAGLRSAWPELMAAVATVEWRMREVPAVQPM